MAVRSNLSKSLYLRGLQCHKSLWLYKHQPDKRKPADDRQQWLFDQGHDVGALARTLFPDGLNIEQFDTFPLKLFQTKKAVLQKQTLYEATFSAQNTLVMTDILVPIANGWHLIEVKSSTGVKAGHLYDMALQLYVLQLCGIRVSKLSLIHINPHYRRGSRLNKQRLFVKVNVGKRVKEHLPSIEKKLAEFRAVIKNPAMPDIAIGPHCSSPYDCDFMDVCWPKMDVSSVFYLKGMDKQSKFELFNQGIKTVNDLPEHFPLNQTQEIQIKAVQTDKPHVNTEALFSFLSRPHLPLFFLDFEAFQTAVPLLKGTKPYQSIPFQFSLHRMNSPFDVPSHSEFLAPARHNGKLNDPRKAFVKQLLKQIPEGACVVVYDKGLERQTLLSLAEDYPSDAERLKAMAHNLVDLIEPFQRHDIYFPAMKGRLSIKSILPALIPQLSYDHLSIRNGEMAIQAFLTLQQTEDPIEIEMLETALKAYCRLDTLAMVRIWQRFYGLLSGSA
ncbi:MAG: DUF2779 domain-containing protein [Candidatus Margulisiibacteriota bacterium]